MTAKPEPTNEELVAEFMGWKPDKMNWYLANLDDANSTREIEAKLAALGFSYKYASELCYMFGTGDEDDSCYAMMTATDAQRLRAIGAVLRGRGGK